MSTGDKTFSINKKQSSFFLLALKISSRVKDAKIPSEGVVALLQFMIKFGYNARCHWLKERAL